ncbi:MAG: hypothetical protein K0S19_716 [Geminicoccaceae bacterium]|nr:hypothetical protein [Geminicoccaceae bacterium]
MKKRGSSRRRPDPTVASVPLPAPCSRCKGGPVGAKFVDTGRGMARCDCERGVKLAELAGEKPPRPRPVPPLFDARSAGADKGAL